VACSTPDISARQRVPRAIDVEQEVCMRQSTSKGASEGPGASSQAPSLGPDAWTVSEPVTAWKEAAADSERWWTRVAVGFGALACLALAGAALRALAGPSPESACSDGVSCNAAGVGYAQASDASDDDLRLAARLFQRACDLGHGPACNNLGLAYEGARGVPLDHERAMLAFERACSNGFAEGCSNQGTLYENGRGVAVNLGDAQRLYSIACRRGSGLGCSNLGVLYAQGRGVNVDGTIAARLFADACAAGSEVGCANVIASEQAPDRTAPSSGTPAAAEAAGSITPAQ
jgi:TPR repeat protein